MAIKDKLPVSYLLFTFRGRINRLTYWTVSIFIWATFYVLFNILESLISYSATWIIYPLLFWALIATATKRLHDINLLGYWIFIVLIPVLGPLILMFLLGFKKGNIHQNRFGSNPNLAPDYFKNVDAEKIPHLKSDERIINDVTQLNPIIVSKVEAPKNIDELREIIKNTDRPISIGGGRFSMGGQTASSNSIHVDMRRLNKVVDFSGEKKTIKVEAGIRWCDIQHIKGTTYYSATLPIKILKTENPDGYKMSPRKSFTSKILKDAQIEHLHKMEISFIEVNDDLELYLFEVYCSICFKCKYNDFRTH